MRLLQIVLISLFINFSSVFAYYENWPPYTFNQGPYKSLNTKPLDDKDIPSFVWDNSNLEQDGDLRFYTVYKFDLQGNSLDDYIVEHTAPSPLTNSVDIFLKKRKDGFQEISYSSVAVGPEDIVDLNKNGQYEVIIGSLYECRRHNYIEYSVYQITGYKLINVDNMFNGFPKFVQMNKKSNDKDTVHLTWQERKNFIKEKNIDIRYESLFGK